MELDIFKYTNEANEVDPNEYKLVEPTIKDFVEVEKLMAGEPSIAGYFAAINAVIRKADGSPVAADFKEFEAWPAKKAKDLIEVATAFIVAYIGNTQKKA